MEPILQFDNVTKNYPNGVHALQGVSFTVQQGEFISVIGPSGSGKSTLLRAINALIPISSGTVTLDGQIVAAQHGRALRSMTARRNIACIVNLHQLDVALQYSTRIIGLSKGRIVFDGPPAQLSDEMIERIYGTSRENLMLGGNSHDRTDTADCA